MSGIEAAPPQPAERIGDWWAEVVDGASDRIVLIDNGRGWTANELDARVTAIAQGLVAQGAGKGSRIGVLFPNSAEWLVAWLAGTRIGAIVVAVSTFLAPRELAWTLHHADVGFLLSARDYLGHRYDQRIAAALPDLAKADGSAPLAIAAVPNLRGIWFDEPVEARWAAGTLDTLAASAARDPRAHPAMLAALAAAVVPADLAMMIYTSGSTAMPKAVVHTHGTVTDKIRFMARVNSIMPVGIDASDRLLVNMPVFWVGGFLTMTGALTWRATILFDDDHGPEAILRAIRDDGATSVSGSEAVLRGVVALDSFRMEDIAGLKPQNVSQHAFFNRFAGPGHHRLADALGMTETLGPHCGDPTFSLPPATGSGRFGRALEGMEHRIVDPVTRLPVPAGEPGELILRGRWLMDGFYKRERRDTFDADGFYATGDKCRLMPDGRLIFEGRLGGMIKTSGANVSPEEVELALLEHPAIVDAAVFGLPDPQREEMVVAVIAVRDDSDLDEAAVRSWIKDRLSAFKVPRRVLFYAADDLPRTPSYKVRKPALIEMVRGSI